MTMPPRDRRREVFISYGGHAMTVWHDGAQCSCGWEWTLFRIPSTCLERNIRRHWRGVVGGDGMFFAVGGPAATARLSSFWVDLGRIEGGNAPAPWTAFFRTRGGR